MTTLIAPPPETKVIRRAISALYGAGKWHFLKENSERICQCGIIITTLFEIEESTLEEVKGKDLCKGCWKFGYE